MINYDRIVTLDTDMFLLQNIDDLFVRQQFPGDFYGSMDAMNFRYKAVDLAVTGPICSTQDFKLLTLQ